MLLLLLIHHIFLRAAVILRLGGRSRRVGQRLRQIAVIDSNVQRVVDHVDGHALPIELG